MASAHTWYGISTHGMASGGRKEKEKRGKEEKKKEGREKREGGKEIAPEGGSRPKATTSHPNGA